MLWNWINGFVGGITLTISVGAFFAQFLEWWYSQEGTKTKFISMPSPPPPPQVSFLWFLIFSSCICRLNNHSIPNDVGNPRN